MCRFQRTPEASAPKVFSPDEAWLRKNVFQWWTRFESLNRALVKMVGVRGFEPRTLRLSSACSNQLSYTPEPDRAARPFSPELVELRRFELLTYSLQSYRSTN